ncbi:MAG: PCP reductase family protein [Nitrospiraceae bacterium]
MLTCGCGRWMHTEGVEERMESRPPTWFVRFECCGCHSLFGIEAPPEEAITLVDRLMWTDEARHVLDRMPPYAATLVRHDVEEYARSKGQRVITFTVLAQARNGGTVAWDPEAERRLDNVPGPVRAMAKVELERTALERGEARVTVALMEEVKAKYFGMAAQKT